MCSIYTSRDKGGSISVFGLATHFSFREGIPGARRLKESCPLLAHRAWMSFDRSTSMRPLHPTESLRQHGEDETRLGDAFRDGVTPNQVRIDT
jgi:hypothetical protein